MFISFTDILEVNRGEKDHNCTVYGIKEFWFFNCNYGVIIDVWSKSKVDKKAIIGKKRRVYLN